MEARQGVGLSEKVTGWERVTRMACASDFSSSKRERRVSQEEDLTASSDSRFPTFPTFPLALLSAAETAESCLSIVRSRCLKASAAMEVDFLFLLSLLAGLFLFALSP